MTKRKRRQFSAEEKVRILRLHLLEGTPVSEVCASQTDQPNPLLPVAEDPFRGREQPPSTRSRHRPDPKDQRSASWRRTHPQSRCHRRAGTGTGRGKKAAWGKSEGTLGRARSARRGRRQHRGLAHRSGAAKRSHLPVDELRLFLVAKTTENKTNETKKKAPECRIQSTRSA